MKKIILIAGPSGAGKTAISNYLAKKYGIPRVVTHTTRPRRAGEVAGKSYHFESPASFKRLHLIEQAEYGGYLYGSSREALERAWQDSDLVSLIVEISGARAYLKQLGPRAFLIYVTVSKKDTLARRMKKRGDSTNFIASRLAQAQLNQLPADLRPYARVLVNDDWDKTKAELDRIVGRLRH